MERKTKNGLVALGRRSRHLLLVLVAAVVIVIPSIGASQDSSAESDPGRRLRIETAGGLQYWDGLAELQPAVRGEFDAAGFNLGSDFYWKRGIGDAVRAMPGLAVAIFNNGSDIHHRDEHLTARGIYLVPSVKWLIGDGAGPVWNLGFGFGIYSVDIAAVESHSNGYDEYELWQDTAVGGYLGGGIEFPTRRSDRTRALQLSAKVHYFGLSGVRDEDLSPIGPPILGPVPRDLSGPLYSIQFAYVWR